MEEEKKGEGDARRGMAVYIWRVFAAAHSAEDRRSEGAGVLIELEPPVQSSRRQLARHAIRGLGFLEISAPPGQGF